MASIALTIAGSDSSGGAGIQADLKTFSAFGVYGASAITALTAQNTHGVRGVMGVPTDFVAQQIDAVADDLVINATKTGMLATRDVVLMVCERIQRHGLHPIVVDPVMIATSGDALLADDAIEAVRARLIPLAELITPNLHEAARLLDEPVAATLGAMERQARTLQRRFGARGVLIKGGHSATADAVDVFVDEAGAAQHFSRPRIDTRHTHGTGCTLSAAIAAGLALGHELPAAIEDAKDYVWRALVAGRELGVGTGNGPLDHHFACRR